MTPYRKAFVFVRGIFAGTLSETEQGYVFVYDKSYIQSGNNAPVSLTLPIQTNPYNSKTLFSFFDGLIPEGWLLDRVSHNWKIDKNDRFGLLLIACKECIGYVSIQGVCP
jgi:serine/threonine-protein kinase HipA